MSKTLAYVEIGDLRYTETQLGLGVAITYTNTAVAGSETVSVSGHAITVGIESGVSTATQIKAAVAANAEASLLVTVAKTEAGTLSNAQVSAVAAPLAGGSAAKYASKTIGSIAYTAKTAGTAGNSITIQYTSGSAKTPVVTVNSSAISLAIKNLVTTATDIMTAIQGDSGANALVSVALASGNQPQYVAFATSPVNLAGGAAATKASVVIQDLTFASDLTGTAKNGSTVTYTTGATNGNEVVTVSGSDISIQIGNGSSTATNIKAAFDAAPAAQGAIASGSIVVNAYAPLHLTAASKNITYGTPDVATKASGTVTVTNYATLHKQKATLAVGTTTYTAVAFGTAGNSITVQYANDLAGGGNLAVVEVPTANTILVHMDDTAVTGTTGDTIKTAVNADPQASLLVVVSGSDAAVQAVQAATPLADGQNAATVTVNGIVLTETTDWAAETDNDTTAANLASAITSATATTLCTAAAVSTNVVTITANADTTGGNGIPLLSSTGTNLATSGSVLAGGKVASTITIGGDTYTCVASAPSASQFSSITELTALIDGRTTTDATDNGSVIAVVAHTAGVAGNSIAVSKTGAGLTFTGATLTGGIDAATVTVAGHVLTESTDWNATVSNDSTAASLASAISALSEVNATPTTNSIAIVAAATGTAGNYAISASDATNLTLSGSALTGGTDAWDCTVSGTGGTAQKTVNAIPTAGGVGEGMPDVFQDGTTALTASFVRTAWAFSPSRIVINNDETSGVKYVVGSWDGVSTHFILHPTESLTLDRSDKHAVWLKYDSAAPAYRLTVVQ